jgi:CSLREA domain-containing protein
MMLDTRYYSSDDPRASRHELLSGSSKAPAPVSTAQASLVVTTLADVVDVTDGQLSLREAVGAANDQVGSDTITFADSIRGGSVVLSLGQLVITDSLTIDGTGETIDADGKSRVLRVDGPDGGTRLDVAIDDLTITGGFIEGNEIRGGGIFVDNAELTVTNSQISGNELLRVRPEPGAGGYADGAGVAAVDSALTIEGSTITEQ